ncbi:dihydrolipoamide acetyltransferase family protein [Aeromicrobium choanae]|uniref:Dihydrolipoamide acetyltransferase component of pyruvate dehydrogenase complex n=1 Tax=Aeromicrobium choanae TaxID=1736691 RepID=A0A1T4YVZ4_9ACTN|nr:dihydrolipoamide acetyltransferase family protein [Aeromicrobium choanae]SKB06017.1 pyruvate dehydrogenase E2 component (dihydrolipoamide acetyltransferase) [Aeromicrobium choanae]
MTNVQQFHLPDVGEGLTEAEIVTWLVAPGDVVEVNQTLVEIETAKSLVELPSPFAGEVTELHAAEGETVDVGRPIISIATAGAAPEEAPESPAGPAEAEHEAADADEPKLLVGYGAKETSGRRRRRAAQQAQAERPAAPSAPAAAPAGPVRTKPPVRKLAKVLGVDLTSLTPTGPGGIVTRADVLDASSSNGASPVAPDPVATTPTDAAPAEIRIPIKGVRKHTAAAMVSSAFTAPHVTEFVTLDITATMDLRARVAARRDFKDVKLSPLCFIAKAFLRAIERTPSANSRWDEAAQEIVQMREVNLGIAAATPRGLVVPNIRSAQRLGLAELATAIADLAATARSGKTPPEAMAQGTVTISNFGVFGVDTGTPILNPGETAILGVGTITRQPWVVGEGADERLEPRWVTTLALSFDHRVMDGQQGSELLADTAAFLRDPALATL